MVKQIGYSDIILPPVFNYGKYKMITWDCEDNIDEDGNHAGYKYNYIELDYQATDDEIISALKTAGLSDQEIEDMIVIAYRGA